MKAGIAIKPGTDVDVLYDILDNSEKTEVPEVRCGAGDYHLSILSNILTDGASNDRRAWFRRSKVYARHDA